MSAYEFYKFLGAKKWDAQTKIEAANTNKIVYTPNSSLRIVLTNLQVASNVAGSIQLWFGGNANRMLFEANLGASAFITPVISGIESTAIDAVLYAVVSNTSGNGWKISAEGFEIE